MYSTGTSSKLWAAVAEVSGQPVQRWLQQWTYQGGFPLIKVAQEGSQVTVSQVGLLSAVDHITATAFSDTEEFLVHGLLNGSLRLLSHRSVPSLLFTTCRFCPVRILLTCTNADSGSTKEESHM